MQHATRFPRTPRSGGFVTTAVMFGATAAALALTLMSGCHAPPARTGFADSAADGLAEDQRRPERRMPHLEAFDEHLCATP